MSKAYFSQAEISLNAEAGSGSRRGATASYLLHQLVADLFGEYDDRPFLYRAEPGRGPVQTVLVLSDELPRRPEEVQQRDFGSARSIRSKPFEIDVEPGTPLDFEIRVNATKDVPQPGQDRSKRRDIWDAAWDEDPETDATPRQLYQEYVQRKLDGAATIVASGLIGREVVRARKGFNRRPIVFVAATLIGTLRVVDGGRLQETVVAGIGRSKAFGCGLLSLSRPGTVLPRRYPEMSLEA